VNWDVNSGTAVSVDLTPDGGRGARGSSTLLRITLFFIGIDLRAAIFVVAPVLSEVGTHRAHPFPLLVRREHCRCCVSTWRCRVHRCYSATIANTVPMLSRYAKVF
jgi:hypothetical protein